MIRSKVFQATCHWKKLKRRSITVIRSKVFQAWLLFFVMTVALFGFAAIFSHSSRPWLGPWLLAGCGWQPLVLFIYAVWISTR